MTLTIHLPPDKEELFKAEAQRRGLPVEEWLVEVASHHVPSSESHAHLQQTDPEEWRRRFNEWANSRDRNLPVLSDEAMSRESIYPDWDLT